MLETLLNEIRAGGTLHPARLAARLNTSPALVEMMLEELERKGMLAQYQEACQSTCDGCSLGSSCGTAQKKKNRLWMLK